MRIGILHIRFYIIDWSAINKVGAGNDKRTIFYAQQTHRREPKRIGAERRTSGEHTHTFIATKQRWTHKRRPLTHSLSIEREFPYKPQIIEPINATQGIGIAILRFKHNASHKFRHKTTLSWNTELCWQLRMIICYRSYIHHQFIYPRR